METAATKLIYQLPQVSSMSLPVNGAKATLLSATPWYYPEPCPLCGGDLLMATFGWNTPLEVIGLAKGAICCDCSMIWVSLEGVYEFFKDKLQN
jgi:hypothetical protein